MLCVLDHLLHLIIGQGGRAGDADGLGLAGRLVPGRDVEYAVGIDVESHLDLGYAARRRCDAV